MIPLTFNLKVLISLLLSIFLKKGIFFGGNKKIRLGIFFKRWFPKFIKIIFSKSKNFLNPLIKKFIKDWSKVADKANIGKPELPVLNKLVQVPVGSEISIQIINKDIYQNSWIM